MHGEAALRHSPYDAVVILSVTVVNQAEMFEPNVRVTTISATAPVQKLRLGNHAASAAPRANATP